MIQTTRNVALDVVTRAVGVLVEDANKTVGQTLEYLRYGFQDIFPDQPDEQLGGLFATARGSLTVEGQTYFSGQRYREYPKTVDLKKYTLRLTITEEDEYWLTKANSAKQVMQIKSLTNNIVNGLNINIDDKAARFIYFAHSTTEFTGGDASALITTSHANRAGATTGTSNNFGSGDTQRPFDGSALTDAISLMHRFVGQNGEQFLPTRRARILCSIEKYPVVQKVLDSVYGPDVANLGRQTASKEALAGRGVQIDAQVITLMPVAYKNYWFIVDLDRAVDHLYMCWGWKPKVADSVEVTNGTKEMVASTLFGPSAIGWQWIFGSKGDSAAIA